MKYKVCNLERDMKLGTKLIKRGEKVIVSQKDYQFLAQVYGMAVKGEIEYTVRVTKPAEICVSTNKAQEPVSTKKRRNKKK